MVCALLMWWQILTAVFYRV